MPPRKNSLGGTSIWETAAWACGTSVVKVPLNPKYRYLFVEAPPLKKHMIIRALRPFVLPYPNRNTERIPPMDIAERVTRRTAKHRTASRSLK